MNDAGKRLIAAAKESALTALRAHRDDLEAERDALLLKNEEITAERDALRSQNDALMRERTSMIATHRENRALAEKRHAADLAALRARVAEMEAGQTEAAAEITRLSSELAEANAALAWCLAMPPEDVSDADAAWYEWLSNQPAGYGQAVTRATTPPLAEPPAG